MRILDEQGNELTSDQADPNKGRLTVEQVLKQHHEAVDPVPEQGHWTDVEGHAGAKAWIVDTPATRGYEAWDEYETIQRYTPYTEEELAQRAEEQTQAETIALRETQLPMAMSMLMASAAPTLTDTQVKAVSVFFPDWTIGDTYRLGAVARYKGELYRALQDSTGQTAQEPDVSSGLWKRIDQPDKDGVYPWSQPLGATDAYKTGDTVTHNGKTWVSDVDGNVWEPGVYGWHEKMEAA